MSAIDGRQPVAHALPQVPLHFLSRKTFLNLVIEDITLVQLLTVMEILGVTGHK